jgi:hypothetical protein
MTDLSRAELNGLASGLYKPADATATMATMARALLEVMDTKPVGFISERDGPVLYGAHISLSPGTHFYTAPPAPSAPDGWKLVPIELSPEMYTAWVNSFEGIYGDWKAMLNAAPAPPGGNG